ncbi:polysaccharide deacetylase family protein [Mycolicibacterium sp. BiH015]|uniref:polysaccharide deacetylase family protein n=1 Tax=Mycolicibacterium sp. BiH015 TaxID=3018808 RepID=UPI0022E79E3D|nr:polysaccharide deacetylase family protein [Mycolicibacterium sp. BiH015]MDA2892709.1 polysaccharide deacetylase family protein [Mycolicibacterium sp. BiH015]
MTNRFRRGFRLLAITTPKSLVVVACAVAFICAPVAHADPVDCARVKCVALTFDDGPGPYTDRLLEILRAQDARATFFLIGDRVAADPAAARRIAGAGMEIGNHTWQHLDMTTLPPQDAAIQFSRATDALVAATGLRPVLARTGFGAIDDAVLAEAGRQGLAVINWDVNTLDYRNDTAATRDLLRTQVRPNAVVLLHDTLAPTVDLMAELVPELAADGYHLVTVSQMLGPRPPGSLYGSRARA